MGAGFTASGQSGIIDGDRKRLWSAVDVLRRAASPMTARQIWDALLAGKTPTATRKQEEALQAALLAALRVRNGKSVVGDGSPARWLLKV
jgi:hypothetical protein